jgi:hypothetical protein
MRLPIRLSYPISAKRLDRRRYHVRNAIALLGIALLFFALQFYAPKFLQFGIDYNASEMRETPSKLVLPDVMASVRSRKSATLAAQSIRTAASSSYRPGTIQVLDRAGLEQASCECYALGFEERLGEYLGATSS